MAEAASNRTSPLAYAALVNRVFTDNVVNREKTEFYQTVHGRLQQGWNA